MDAEQLWEILVPTIRNDGRFIKTRFHRVWDSKVRGVAGGLTILSPAVGYWQSPGGTLFRERMIPVRIRCNREQILEIAEMSLKYYEQEAIFLYKVSDECYIYDGNNR